MLVHILGVGAALALAAELKLPPVSEPFRWEVALVEPPTPPTPQTPVKAEPQPIVETVPAPSPITRKVMTPIPPMDRQPIEQPPPQPVVQQASEVPPQESLDVVTQETTYNASVVARATPTELTRHTDTVMEREEAVPVPHEARLTQVITPETTHKEAVRNEAVLEQLNTQPVVHQTAAQTVFKSHTDPVMEREEAVPIRRSATVVQDSPQQILAPTVVTHRPIKQRQLRAYGQAQRDYGWLRDALWNRIEQLKRYPAQAKANHWEGKVVLEAVIRDDGTIIDLKVAESSSYAVLDQEALNAVKKASPLSLKHPLGQPRITILVPISYKLDR
jgi:periplasmic protein TonB